MRRVQVRSGLALLWLAWCAMAASAARAQERVADAENLLRTGRYEDALALFARLGGGRSASARAARGYVGALAEVGRYAEAERVARRFIESNPGSPELWNALGEVLYARGEREEAEAAFRRATVEQASDALDARLNLAVLRYDRGDVSQALTEFDRFVDVYNRNGGRGLSSQELAAVGTALRYLGVNDWQLYKDALRAYDEAIAADPGNLEPRVLLGELFLDKYNSGDAAASFEDVLELNPSHPRALLGTARLLRFDGRPGALERARQALEVNPQLVPARTFVAELLLEIEDYDGAEQEANLALEVNPVSLEALAVLAAARRLRGDEAGFVEARDSALAVNPRYAELYNKLAELSARVRLYAQAVKFARSAIALDPKSWRGYGLLGINQLRTGEIEDGKHNLEIAFDGDPYDVWTKNTLDLLDTFEDYQETRTARFVISVDGRESALLSLYFADLAEEAYDRLAERYGYRPPTPIRVEVFRNHADFSVRTVGLVGFGALGVSFGPVIAMDAPSARAAGEYNWGSTLWHELAHTFHLGMTDHKVPRWFSEGLAVFEERRARPGWGDDVTPGFLTAYLQGRILPVAELNNGFARPAYPEQLIYSYYEASLVCELIESEGGPGALVGMLAAFRDGLGTDQALRRVLGSGVDEFGDRFFAYLDERFAGPLAAMRPKREIQRRPSREQVARWVRDDPDDFSAQLAYAHILFEAGGHLEAIPYFEQAKRLFPEYAGPGSAYRYLALIYKEQGSLERAERELAALTSINERDYQANLELAEIREALGDVAGAAAALERVNYISPYEISLHTRLAGLYSEMGARERVIRERKAVLALDPVDKAEALYQLARAYYEAGDLASARGTVLRALEDAPGFEAAQDLLLEIRASRGGTR